MKRCEGLTGFVDSPVEITVERGGVEGEVEKILLCDYSVGGFPPQSMRFFFKLKLNSPD